MAVEEAKPKREQGYYIHPELFGAPSEMGIEARRILAEREKETCRSPSSELCTLLIWYRMILFPRLRQFCQHGAVQKTRRGTQCQCRAMPNGRCRLHGGLSTGPRTLAGIDRIRLAVTKHGRYSKRAKAERKYYRGLLRHCREMLWAI
jgi:hypothetical protein